MAQVSRRAMLGAVIVVAWLAGLVTLVRREYFRPQVERLAEAALRVSPGATFYGVMQGAEQIGFASSNIDTTLTSIRIRDYLVADLPVGGKRRRASVTTNIVLSRALRMREFDFSVEAEGSPLRAAGRVDGDSVLVLSIRSGSDKPDSQRVPLTGPVLLPTIVPLAIALGEHPRVGKEYVLPVFDPAKMGRRDIKFQVGAESLFVLSDSAVFDSATTRWRGAIPDTIRAWQVVADSSGGFSGWIDEQGRIVQTSQLGLDLRRLPYAVAFENWRIQSAERARVSADRDILETTAIAANKQLHRDVKRLRVRLSSVALGGFALDGQRQRLVEDTLIVTREPDSALDARYSLPAGGRLLDRANTRREPLIQSDDPQIKSLGRRIAGAERDPRRVTEAITKWVHDSLGKRITFGVPNALRVLEARSGDCNEHTQLFVALARSVGIPARIAAGLVYLDGKFYYHAWPEVLLTDWTAVDPTFGQFPADAAHLRFVIGGLAQQADLLRLMGNLRIDVVDVQ
jgi:transglutaminase-like putative cysteine protease